MESTIYKTLKGSQMEMIFEQASNIVNVKCYHAKNEKGEYVNGTKYNPTKTYEFEMRVKHSDNDDPSKQFDKAISKMFGKKQTKPKPTHILTESIFMSINQAWQNVQFMDKKELAYFQKRVAQLDRFNCGFITYSAKDFLQNLIDKSKM